MNKHIEEIEKALEHAKAKHPFFAHRVFQTCGVAYASRRLREIREELDDCKNNDNVNGGMVLDCELAEAQEAYSRGDYAHCLEELAQVGAVNIRMMEAVEEKMKGGGE